MCGIVGYVGKDNCIPKILYGLESLEYRGYDSAGIAYQVNGKIVIKKEQGRLTNLENEIESDETSLIGIGHTRWATHGKPSKTNSHPHQVGDITLVHNGIIENYEELKKELNEYEFISETDTEVLTAYIYYLYKKEKDILKVLKTLKNKIKGSYALGILITNDKTLYAIRNNSPLIIGVSDTGNFIASDVPAILKYTKKYYLLNNHEYATLTEDEVVIYDEEDNVTNKELLEFEGNNDAAMKNGYDHFMLKEIYEQSEVIPKTINEYIKDYKTMKERLSFLDKYKEIDIIGCGSAYHVGYTAKNLIEKYGNIRVNVGYASEYRYTKNFYSKNHLIILISQSGETADTLAVLREAKEQGIPTLAIVNVVGSSIAREADKVLYIKAGPEIAVATTKAYTCQLALLSVIACYLGIKNKILDISVLNSYKDLTNLITNILESTKDTEEVADHIKDNQDIFFLGRKIDYSLCMEASLKLKEISYKHSEAYPGGELKHGTISLVEQNTPVISIISDEDIKLKTLSNIKEVCARGAYSIIITNQEIIDNDVYNYLIKIPYTNDLISPMLLIIKCQLIAYYVAKYNNCDIDKPRNLAKSVTVE